MENECLLTLYCNVIMGRSLYWYIESLRILTNTYTTALTSKPVIRKVLRPPYVIEHTPLSPKNGLNQRKRKNSQSVKGERISRKHY